LLRNKDKTTILTIQIKSNERFAQNNMLLGKQSLTDLKTMIPYWKPRKIVSFDKDCWEHQRRRLDGTFYLETRHFLIRGNNCCSSVQNLTVLFSKKFNLNNRISYVASSNDFCLFYQT